MSVPKVYFAGKISSDYRSKIFGCDPMIEGHQDYLLYGHKVTYSGCFKFQGFDSELHGFAERPVVGTYQTDHMNDIHFESDNKFKNLPDLSNKTFTEYQTYDNDLRDKFLDSVKTRYQKLFNGTVSKSNLIPLWSTKDSNCPYEHWECRIGLTRRNINDLCSKLISSCDIFFVHIDSADCFGTLAEIGYAASLKKPIFITFSRTLGYQAILDMWFITEYPSVVSCYVTTEPKFIDPAIVGILGFERFRLISLIDDQILDYKHSHLFDMYFSDVYQSWIGGQVQERGEDRSC